MYGMNRILTEIGWAAAVDGFIPPMLYGISGICAGYCIRHSSTYKNTRQDIIHEGAGHALLLPIRNMNIYVVLEK
jgi:hypothetical protein